MSLTPEQSSRMLRNIYNKGLSDIRQQVEAALHDGVKLTYIPAPRHIHPWPEPIYHLFIKFL